ncbi:hypothetical protein MTO96_020962 [Rhipicephalus appendiculatus]
MSTKKQRQITYLRLAVRAKLPRSRRLGSTCTCSRRTTAVLQLGVKENASGINEDCKRAERDAAKKRGSGNRASLRNWRGGRQRATARSRASRRLFSVG